MILRTQQNKTELLYKKKKFIHAGTLNWKGPSQILSNQIIQNFYLESGHIFHVPIQVSVSTFLDGG